MKKEKKNILPKAAAGALLSALIVFCVMLNVEKNALTAYEKGKVLTAARDLAKGLVLTPENVGEYFEEKEIDRKLVPEAAILDPAQLFQKMTAQDVDKGALVTGSMFQDPEEVRQKMLEPVVAGFKAEDLYQVVSGILRSGDRIHIYTVDAETGGAYLVWDDVYIRDVFDASGVSIAAGDRTTAAQRINILMEKENVEQFYTELANGSLRVVKVAE